MKKYMFLIATCLIIVGCATATSSNVQRVGDDIYTITTYMDGLKDLDQENSAKTRIKGLEVANSFCSKLNGKYVDLVKENISKDATATAIIYFRCK